MKTVYYADDLHRTERVVRLDDLQVPIHVAIGRYEAATTEELDDLIADLSAERERR